MLETDADGFCTVRAPLAHDVDPRDALYDRARAAGARLRALGLVRPRLEDFFQQVTEGFVHGEESAP